jgi:hypothetical protein
MSRARLNSISSMSSASLGGRDASAPTLCAAIGAEIDRLEREAETLRRLRDTVFGVGTDNRITGP